MTKADKENLNNCPDNKWFNDVDVFPKVKRANYTLGRLVEAGELKTKVTDDGRFYRKVTRNKKQT